MKVFDKIYIAKYQNASTLYQLAKEIGTSKEKIKEVIEELKATGKNKIYKNIPDEEWENLENKTEEYVLSKYSRPIKSNREIFQELIDAFAPEVHNFEIFDATNWEEKRKKDTIILCEEWKEIEGYNYSVSNYGRIKNNTSQKIKALRNGIYGYQVNLWNKSEAKMFTLSRLVANYFIRKVKDDERVIHKDQDIRNNYYKNLEIVTKVGE